MSDKKQSDTLRQQRFARQEFLRLKKMQQGELDAGPKPSELAVPLTFSEKLKNIWYHDRFVIIILALLIVAISALCVQCATKTKYDATVVVFTYSITGDPNCQKMGEYIKPFCDDINGDGEVNVNVVNCSINYSEGNPEANNDYNYTNRAKAQSLIATDPSALLFITDSESYKYLQSLSDEIQFFVGEPIKFEDDFYKVCVDESGFFDTPKGLQISCRTIKGTAIENGKNVETHFEQAKKILNGLKDKYTK